MGEDDKGATEHHVAGAVALPSGNGNGNGNGNDGNGNGNGNGGSHRGSLEDNQLVASSSSSTATGPVGINQPIKIKAYQVTHHFSVRPTI
jgi:hypothetical protein